MSESISRFTKERTYNLEKDKIPLYYIRFDGKTIPTLDTSKLIKERKSHQVKSQEGFNKKNVRRCPSPLPVIYSTKQEHGLMHWCIVVGPSTHDIDGELTGHGVKVNNTHIQECFELVS